MEEQIRETKTLPEITFFFEDFLKYLKRLFYVPVILALAASIVLCGYSYLRYHPMYEAYATFAVQLNGQYGAASSYYSKATAEQLEKTFPAILNSGILNDTVANDLGVDKLPASIHASAGNAALFTIRCTAADPGDAYDVLMATIKNYPSVAQYVVGDTSLLLVDESGIPEEPYNSVAFIGSVKKGCVIGIVLSAALIALLAATRKTVRSVEDIRRILNIRCIASLPQIRIKRRSDSSGENHIIAFRHNVSRSYTDAVRLMGVRAEAFLKKEGGKVLMVTSAVPGEGKTSVSSGLALAFSKQGKSVALIDCDLRNPSVLPRFKKDVGEQSGIFEYLCGQVKLPELFLPLEPNLCVVHAGKPVQNASEVLDSAAVRRLIEYAGEQFDVVILDTPPSYLLSDALSVAKVADSVLFVIKRNYARTHAVTEAVDRIAETKLPFLGCVLNG